MDSDQAARLLLIGGVGLVIVLALAFIAFGYYFSVVKPRQRTVLQVDDIKVSYASMKRRMGYELFQNVALQQNPARLPQVAYDALVDELTIVARADDIGVSVDSATLDQRLRSRIGVTAEADQRTFQDGLRQQLSNTGLSESEYRRLVQAEALETAIKDKFSAEIPATVQQARVEVISASSIDAAREAITRINAGEPFADVAKALSQEPDVQETGGVHEYGPEGTLSAVYNDFAFSAEIGALSEPLPAGNGTETHFVVRVIDRSDQPVRDDQKPTLAQSRYDDWLTDTKEALQSSGALVNKWTEDAQRDALVAVIEDAKPRLQAQQRENEEIQSIQLTAAAGAATQQAQVTPAGEATPGAEQTAGAVTTPSGDSTSSTSGDTPASPPPAATLAP